MYESSLFRDHSNSPAISIFILNDEAPTMEKFSCWYCKRTIADVKGTIDTIITTPTPLIDFGIAVNIRCKLCKQNYRLLANAQTVQG